MLDVNNGWALNNSEVLRTTDGGSTWYNATPAGVSGLPASSFFLDSTTGWVVLPGADPTSGTLYHTTDGGTSWTSNTRFPSAAARCNSSIRPTAGFWSDWAQP